MHHLQRFILVCLLVCLLPLTSYAWNSLGHKVIAQIAYDHLNPAAKSQVDRLIASFHQEYPKINSLIDAASWPDEIRSQKIEMFTHWHYIDNAITTDHSSLKNLMDSDNAVWAVSNMVSVVQNQKANTYERARFLVFLTHITGDLYQPLHTVSLITAEHPNGDKGGNDFYVKYQGSRTKLHHVWDGGVGLFGNDESKENIAYLAKAITTEYPDTSFAKINDLKPNDWADEGVIIAKEHVYNITENTNVSNAYIVDGRKTTTKQTALAGYRLAALLNNLLT